MGEGKYYNEDVDHYGPGVGDCEKRRYNETLEVEE